MATADRYDEKRLESTGPQVHDSDVGEVHEAHRKHSIVSRMGDVINASGHRDQLQRQYGLLSICG